MKKLILILVVLCLSGTAQALTGKMRINSLGVGKKIYINSSQNTKMTNGLIGLWSFDGADISGTTAYDRSGRGNNGTLVASPTKVAGKLGQSLSFNGTSQYVTLGNSVYINSGTPFTVACWVYLNGFAQQYPEPITLRTNTTAPFEIAFSNQTSYLGIIFGSGTDATWYHGKNDAPASTYVGKWTHVVITYNGAGVSSGTNFKLYTNGSSSAHNATGVYAATSQQSLLGGIGLASYNAFSGKLDDVRIYNRALSASEVSQLYKLGTNVINSR